MTAPTKTYSYDEVPYPNNPFPQSHPDRLATIATLFGMSPQPIDHCRVLELGSGRGGNLLPMAEQLPGSQFVGVELSKIQISEAQELAERLQLGNIELKHMNILDVDAQLGQFDYIICHGVFSWVPTAVQDKILEICAANLSPQGVAYVSYNTYPGWNMRGMIRYMMCYHSQHFDAPQVRIDQARALLDFLVQHSPQNDCYGAFLKRELEMLQRSDDSYLFHEHLEDVNEPTYFHRFAERAEACGLRYLGESDMSAMYTGHIPADVWTTLESVSSNLIQMEQYMDFLRNRTFRQTLLCHQDVSIDRTLHPSDLEMLHVISPLVAENAQANVRSMETLNFRHRQLSEHAVAMENPLLKAALVCLANAWPGSVPFPLLLAKSRLRVDQRSVVTVNQIESQRIGLATELLRLYVHNLIELHAVPQSFTAVIGKCPKVSHLARIQAEKGKLVTTRRHVQLMLDDLQWHLLQLLDGTLDHSALLNALVKLVDDQVFVVQLNTPDLNRVQLRAHLSMALEQALQQFCAAGLLISGDVAERAVPSEPADVSANAGEEIFVKWAGLWQN